MNTKLALLMTLLAACGAVEEAPVAPAAVHTFELKGMFLGHEKEVASAVQILSKEYGHDVKAALSTVDVTISGTNQEIVCGKLTTNVAGCSHLSDSTRADLELFMLPQQHINETSLIHELGHTARKLIEGDSDGAHSDKEFWSMIGKAELEFETTK